MLYCMRDVIGTQKRIDDRIWRMIDQHYAARVKFLMLDGMKWPSLVPMYRSIAYSDFWAMADTAPYRIRETLGFFPVIAQRYDIATRERVRGKIHVEDWAGKSYVVKPEEVLAVVFRYGESFADLDNGFLAVFPVFQEYLEFRKREPIQFVKS